MVARRRMKGLRWLIGRRMTHTTWLLAARVSDLAAGRGAEAVCLLRCGGARLRRRSVTARLRGTGTVPGTGLLGGGRESSRLALLGGLGISAGRLPPHCAPKFWFMAARVVPRGSQCWRQHIRAHTQQGQGAKTYRVACALFSPARLISQASLPVFHRGWGRSEERTPVQLTAEQNK